MKLANLERWSNALRRVELELEPLVEELGDEMAFLGGVLNGALGIVSSVRESLDDAHERHTRISSAS